MLCSVTVIHEGIWTILKLLFLWPFLFSIMSGIWDVVAFVHNTTYMIWNHCPSKYNFMFSRHFSCCAFIFFFLVTLNTSAVSRHVYVCCNFWYERASWHVNMRAAEQWSLYGWWFHDNKRGVACGKTYNDCRWRYLLFLHQCHRMCNDVFSFSNASAFVPTALEILVEKRITGFPVIDDDWKLASFPYLWFWVCLECFCWYWY